jgi:CheY-like chemotaxis protein
MRAAHQRTDADSRRRGYRPPVRTHGRPVVIVEDDDDIREAFADVLVNEGYQVLTATNGREALSVLDGLHGAPCLVLLDLMMPVMNGWQFLHELEETHRLGRVPVVVISAAPAHTEGAARVIPKPVDVDALLAAVRDFS